VAILAWSVFAFGGVYPSTLAVPGLLIAALAAAYRPLVLRRGRTPELDAAILLVVAATVAQLVPLPQAILAAISPGALAIAGNVSLVEPTGPLPIALDLQDAAGAVLLLTGALSVFFISRQIFESGGVRTVTRGLALTGLLLSGLAIAQDATAHGMMYWRWRPIYERAYPFGPFVNRNHFGTWAMMVVPLCIGYLVAHTEAHRHAAGTSWRGRLLSLLDARAWQLVSSIVLLTVGTVVSLSRSAMLGLGASIAVGGLLALSHARQTRHEPRMLILLAITGGIIVGATVLRIEPAAITDRIRTADVGLSGRLEIWEPTAAIVRDFWLTGTGVGTYPMAMVMYQRTSPGVIFNQAHNHYLQVAAEGGLLVGLPLLLALAAFVRRAAAALARDRSGMYWLRAGAAAGLAGVAVQSLFETGLLTPANGLAAAVLAAIVVHVPGRYGPDRLR